MVHALSESWRILKIGGRLIDLRPYCTKWKVEILSKDKSIIAGDFISKEIGLIDDVMSDEAITEIINNGLFKEESKEFFDYAYYWDSFDQMFDYVNTTWSNLVSMPKNVLLKTRQIEQEMGEKSLLRISRRILIASYRKLVAKEGITK